jgi:flagellin-like protein
MKAISPIIAAVILIAFVIAVAVIASPFLTAFIKGRVAEIEREGAGAVDCMVANFDIDPETVYTNDTNNDVVRLTIFNGRSPLGNFRLIIYQGINTTQLTPDLTGTVAAGETAVLQNTATGLSTERITRIKVITLDCPVTDSVSWNEETQEWE